MQDQNDAPIKFRPATSNQIDGWDLMKKKQLIILAGSAGTGKSEMACARAAELWKSGKVDNIYICRPHCTLGKSFGATKGNDCDKLLPFVMPMMIKLSKYIGEDLRDYLVEDDLVSFLESGEKGIHIIPVEKIQGRSFSSRDFIIVDEFQNCEVVQAKAVVTRLERGCQMVLCGDETQPARQGENGLSYLLNLWERHYENLVNFQGVIRFEISDCQRKGVSAAYTRIFEEDGKWIDDNVTDIRSAVKGAG